MIIIIIIMIIIIIIIIIINYYYYDYYYYYYYYLLLLLLFTLSQFSWLFVKIVASSSALPIVWYNPSVECYSFSIQESIAVMT